MTWFIWEERSYDCLGIYICWTWHQPLSLCTQNIAIQKSIIWCLRFICISKMGKKQCWQVNYALIFKACLWPSAAVLFKQQYNISRKELLGFLGSLLNLHLFLQWIGFKDLYTTVLRCGYIYCCFIKDFPTHILQQVQVGWFEINICVNCASYITI